MAGSHGRRRETAAAFAAAAALLAACAPEGFPDEPLFADSRDLEPPELAPLDTVLDAETDRAIAESRAELEARGATLRDRAEALRRRDL